jgi:cell division protein ZapD
VFNRGRLFASRATAPDHQAALHTIFELVEMSSRSDLKSDLLQELERQKLTLIGFKDNAEVDQPHLTRLIGDIEAIVAKALSQTAKTGSSLRENEWLMNVKQRMSLPGGACSFDLPALHYWLSRDVKERKKDLEGWLAPFEAIEQGVAVILKMLRGSGTTASYVAKGGSFQLMQQGVKTVPQLLRVAPSAGIPAVPEISANKYAIGVRFIGIDTTAKGKPYTEDVPFDLTLYSL